MSYLAKAVIAGLTTFGAGFVTAIGTASPGGETVLGSEWVLIGVSTAVSALMVWAVPNKSASPND